MIASTTQILDSATILIFLKGSILLILFLYAIFALIVVKQVNLMGKTLITNVSSLVKAFAIIHAGFAIGIIFLAWGML